MGYSLNTRVFYVLETNYLENINMCLDPNALEAVSSTTILFYLSSKLFVNY